MVVFILLPPFKLMMILQEINRKYKEKNSQLFNKKKEASKPFLLNRKRRFPLKKSALMLKIIYFQLIVFSYTYTSIAVTPDFTGVIESCNLIDGSILIFSTLLFPIITIHYFFAGFFYFPSNYL